MNVLALEFDRYTIGLGLVALFVLIMVMVLWRFLGLYIRAWISGASVSAKRALTRA